MKTLKTAVWSIGLIAAFNLGGRAQAGNVVYDGTGANNGGAGGDLNIGREFSVTGSGVIVGELGFYDAGGHVLVDSHTVTLFVNNGSGYTPVAGGSVTIPAGLSSASQFVYEPLAGPLSLAAGNYAVVAYGTNNARDGYGDGGGLPAVPNITYGNFDPYQFTSAASPAFPNGGDGNNHSSASLILVPEPSSVFLCCLGAVSLLFGVCRRNA